MKQFTAEQLISIYNNCVKKKDDYFKKHNTLPKCEIKLWNYSWKGKDCPRCFCILDFMEWVKKHNIDKGHELAITCAGDPELEFISYKNTTVLKYPPHDLHFFDEKFILKFDFFIFNQTIEHLYNPFKAIENIYKYMKSGGYVFTSVPTINIPHMTPIHYNGYNPMGLALLFMSCGFEVIEIGQWGNYDYIQKLFKHHWWPDATQVSIVNEEKNVAQCWILAKKN